MDRSEPYTEDEIKEQEARFDLWYSLFDTECSCSGCGETAMCYVKREDLKICIICARSIVTYIKQNKMTGKIEECSFTGRTYDSQYGKMYVHSVKINGVVGQASFKSEMPEHAKAGTEVEYTLTEDEFGKKYKISKIQTNNFKSDPEREKKIIRQSCLSTAVNFLHGTATDKKMITDLAEYFESWVNR